MKTLTALTLATCLALVTSCTKEELVTPQKANTPDITPDCVFPFAPLHEVTNDDPGAPDPVPPSLALPAPDNGPPALRSEHRWPPTIPDLQY